MAQLIKNRQSAEDQYVLLDKDCDAGAIGTTPALVPLERWLELDDAEQRLHGVWLDSDQEVEALCGDLNRIAVIALNFPAFTDGRAYSYARLLRRQGYEGEIRAIGDVLRDQLFYMARCGFDSFALRDDQDLETCLSAFADFSVSYQECADQGPLFARR